jgi:ankyrin repeat protein
MAVVRALIEHGADVNIASKVGATYIAAEKGHMDIVRALAEHRAEISGTSVSAGRKIAIIAAAAYGHMGTISLLLLWVLTWHRLPLAVREPRQQLWPGGGGTKRRPCS